MITPESIADTLREINSRVPKLLRERAIKEVKVTPTIEFVYQKFIDDGYGTPEQREKVQALLDSGVLSKTKPIEDPKVTKQIDQFITREIKKAVKQGKLPKDATPYTKVLYEKVYNQKN